LEILSAGIPGDLVAAGMGRDYTHASAARNAAERKNFRK
jgi:hypothetical protein